MNSSVRPVSLELVEEALIKCMETQSCHVLTSIAVHRRLFTKPKVVKQVVTVVFILRELLFLLNNSIFRLNFLTNNEYCRLKIHFNIER